MQETDLYALWEQKLPETALLRTNSGDTVRIVSPGRRNPISGPDYRRCILEVNGEFWTGDVELHVNEQDWNTHGHEGDGQFSNIQLHLCMSPAESNVDSKQIHRTVILEDQSDVFPDAPVELRNLPPIHSPDCCPAGRSVRSDPNGIKEVLKQLERFGKQRIARRRRIISERSSASTDRTYLLARVLLETMGLHRNKKPMTLLAGSLSFDQLKQSMSEHDHPEDQQQAGEYFLLKRAGLLRKNQTGLHRNPTWKRYRNCLSNRSRFSVEPLNLPWNLNDPRPVNTPYRRIAAFVSLFQRFFVTRSPERQLRTLIDHVLSRWSGEPSKQLKLGRKLVDPLTVNVNQASSSYWIDHSKPGVPLHRPTGLVGEHRAAVSWINGLLLFLSHLGRQSSTERLNHTLDQICCSCPFPLGDRRVENVRTFLFGSHADEIPLTPYIEQGMHEIHKRYCVFGNNGCTRCQIRSSLEKSI